MNMLKKTLKIFLIISHGLFFPSFIFAETVVLKSGQTLDTKIIEKTDKYIKVEVDSTETVLRYPLEQIESIDGRRLESISKTNSTAQESLVTSDASFDSNYTEFDIFKIKLPRGWKVFQKFYRKAAEITIAKLGTSNGFTIKYMPIDSTLRNASDNMKEIMLKTIVEGERDSLKEKGVAIDKQPTKIIFQNVPALQFDTPSPEPTQRLSHIAFIKEGYAFSIGISTSISEFELYNGIINNSLNTFQISRH